MLKPALGDKFFKFFLKLCFTELFFYVMKNLIENSSSIVIVSHKNPDGDAIGSSLALFNYLKKIKKQ